MAATLLAQLSDPHVRTGRGDGASARTLAAAVDAVLALRTAPDAVLVSGDLADHATAAEYERVRELLAPLPMPVHVLPGNHDDPDGLREHLGSPLRFAVRVGGLRLVACDTTLAGRDCRARRAPVRQLRRVTSPSKLEHLWRVGHVTDPLAFTPREGCS